jgi:16S rRNA (adenine1518-N6/adenine1519-N6)-dimethyltransferase
MSITTIKPLDIPSLLRQYDLSPSKGLGQNFLQDEQALEKITAAAELGPQDHVLEIGPGLGSLTRHLATSAARVTAVELDARLFPALTTVLAGYSNVTLIQGDILKLDPAEMIDQPQYAVVANIPYYITSAVIRHLLEGNIKPAKMVLTLQKEVAERIVAADGKMSLLALSVQVYGRPVMLTRIPAGAFYPAPKVDSAVLRIDIHPQPRIPVVNLDRFFRLIKAGFSQKRKTLRNSLSAGLRMSPEEAEDLLTQSGIDPKRRAETLNLEDWGKLVSNNE